MTRFRKKEENMNTRFSFSLLRLYYNRADDVVMIFVLPEIQPRY